MNANGYFQLVFYFAVLLLLAKPLGIYMAEVYEGRSAALRFGRPLERLLYRVSGIDPEKEMRCRSGCRSIRKAWRRSRPILRSIPRSVS